MCGIKEQNRIQPNTRNHTQGGRNDNKKTGRGEAPIRNVISPWKNLLAQIHG